MGKIIWQFLFIVASSIAIWSSHIFKNSFNVFLQTNRTFPPGGMKITSILFLSKI